ncbi:MAG: hypothetical protein AB7G37_14255 [Solirubrobacteraceae bacterium]
MGLSYAITAATILWLVLWALGWKSVDATLIAAGIILVSIAAHRALQYLPGRPGPGGPTS